MCWFNRKNEPRWELGKLDALVKAIKGKLDTLQVQTAQ